MVAITHLGAGEGGGAAEVTYLALPLETTPTITSVWRHVFWWRRWRSHKSPLRLKQLVLLLTRNCGGAKARNVSVATGSGVVILRIPNTVTATFTAGVTQTSSSVGSDTVYIITATTLSNRNLLLTQIKSDGVESLAASKVTGLELGQVDTPQTFTTNKTVGADVNSLMVGDITINSGVTLTHWTKLETYYFT